MAIPARVLALNGDRARVATDQQEIEVGRFCVPELEVGDWVLVNTGQIVNRLTAEEAEATRELIRELRAIEGT